MKNLLLLLFCGITSGSFCQVNFTMPPEANTFYENAMRTIKSQVKNVIEKNANNLRGRKVNTDSLFKSLHKDQALKNITQGEIEAVTVLIMVRASKNADNDLKDLVVNMHKNNNENPTDNDRTQNKAQVILTNKSQIAENISLLMKKLSGSKDLAIDNLK
ncbi:MAG: hypothetical protein ABI208_01200 [Ginsengibacter sp.]